MTSIREIRKISEKKFKNTFADCENTELTVGTIFVGLKLGFLNYDKLPKEVQRAVDKEIAYRYTKRFRNTFAPMINDRYLSIAQLTDALVFHDIRPDELSKRARSAMNFDVKKNTGLTLQRWWNEYHAAKYYSNRSELVSKSGKNYKKVRPLRKRQVNS